MVSLESNLTYMTEFDHWLSKHWFSDSHDQIHDANKSLSKLDLLYLKATKKVFCDIAALRAPTSQADHSCSIIFKSNSLGEFEGSVGLLTEIDSHLDYIEFYPLKQAVVDFLVQTTLSELNIPKNQSEWTNFISSGIFKVPMPSQDDDSLSPGM